MKKNSISSQDASMNNIPDKQKQYEEMMKKRQEMMKKRQEEIIKQMILMVTRQTEYSYEEAENKLKEQNYNYNDVIKEYMGIPIKKKEPQYKTTNQAIYSEIRGLMDDAASSFRQQQEITEARNKYIEQYQKMVQQQKAASQNDDDSKKT